MIPLQARSELCMQTFWQDWLLSSRCWTHRREPIGSRLLRLAVLSLLLSSNFPTLAQAPPPSCTTKQTAKAAQADPLVQPAYWMQTAIGMVENTLSDLSSQIEAYLNVSPWPAVNERAKLARVPVMMYHDILPEKLVFFDVTPEEFEQHLQLIRNQRMTPITLQQLAIHLSTGLPLPAKPVLLTFDDGYAGHYKYVYPLLKKYGYPATFAIYPAKVGKKLGRSSVTWEELQEMAADPLVTIAAHSVTHPSDLRVLDDEQLHREVFESKQTLETQLGIPIDYFVYPTGYYDERVAAMVTKAGYKAAVTMDDANEGFAGQSKSLLEIKRFGQSRTAEILPQAWGGPSLPRITQGFDFKAPLALNRATIDTYPLLIITGGQPITIHAKSRYQVENIVANTKAVAAVAGGFFSLEFLDSNTMIGPVFSQGENQFIPGKPAELKKIGGRPLVLISPKAVRFIPFDTKEHNTLEGVQAEMPDVTDAFVSAAWLVKGGKPQPAKSFGTLFDFDAARHRTFWGVNVSGQPVVGVSAEPVDSVTLGTLLVKAGLRDAVMLDSGASTSLVYQKESLVGYTPRPVPHVVALIPPQEDKAAACVVANQ